MRKRKDPVVLVLEVKKFRTVRGLDRPELSSLCLDDPLAPPCGSNNKTQNLIPRLHLSVVPRKGCLFW